MGTRHSHALLVGVKTGSMPVEGNLVMYSKIAYITPWPRNPSLEMYTDILTHVKNGIYSSSLWFYLYEIRKIFKI